MFRLYPPSQSYPWGSVSAIPALFGEPETGLPVAELWLGAHPTLPAEVDRGDGRGRVSLAAAIAADPTAWLGASAVARFGVELPFLLKVLAADQPLSIQAHPSKAQAEAGFAAENAAGVPLGAPNRNYRDANHKPELLLALTEFEGLCGFVTVEEAVSRLGGIDAPLLVRAVEALTADGSQSDADRLRESVRIVLGSSADDVGEAMARVRLAVGARPALAIACDLDHRYPDDPGVLVALLLNRVTLAPGEAVFLGAGNLHAYLHGLGVEIMASSDNVLRGGLTAKHVDVDELVAVLDPRPGAVPFSVPRPAGPGVLSWPVPVDDFLLWRVELGASVDGPAQVHCDGPAVVLVIDGAMRVASASGTVALARGQSAVSMATPTMRFDGRGTAFVATVGPPRA